MTHPTAVILVVGLNESLLRHAPRLSEFAGRGTVQRLKPVLPAVTCSVQSSMLTGVMPSQHGIVGNGWFNADLQEVQFWKQSNRLVTAEKVWETARQNDPSVTCANLFWWYNMYSSAEYSVTPRPIYKADGRKLPDVYTHPASLRFELQQKLGTFPLFQFWGPGSSIKSSEWIAAAAMEVYKRHSPTLTLVYLPHLDYALQKLGPDDDRIPEEVAQIDRVVGELLDFFADRIVRTMIVSEYGIESVTRPIHINRVLRKAGGIAIREEEGLELLDAGASDAFAVADHQVAHVYVRDAADVSNYMQVCRSIAGVEHVMDRRAQTEWGIDHNRSGDLVLVAESGSWFTYYYWLDDCRAPDFARTVDIHRKPGYDPAELFLDPAIRFPKLRIGCKLLQKKLGFRTLMDVIPLDAGLVRGSHGRVDQPAERQPLLITQRAKASAVQPIACTAVRDVILEHLFT